MDIGFKVAASVAALALSGLFGVKGNGTVKEEVRQVGGFSGVEVSHAIQAQVTVGPQTSVKVEADENLLPLIKTEVSNGVLKAYIQGESVRPSRDIKLTVVTPQLSSAAASGASSITAQATPGQRFEARASGASKVAVKGVKAQEVEATASGSSSLDLSGTGEHASVKLSGAATLLARELSTDSLALEASGASQADARVSRAVAAHLSGASHLRVLGTPPQREVHTSGASGVSYEDQH